MVDDDVKKHDASDDQGKETTYRQEETMTADNKESVNCDRKK